MARFAQREGLHISHSQVRAWLTCPRQHELRYIRGEAPAFVPVPLAFGTAIHAGLAAFYGAVKLFGSPPSLEEVVQAFSDSWTAVAKGPVPLQRAGEDEDDSDHLDKGAAMLKVFYESANATGVSVDAVEKPFSIALYEPDTGEVLDEKLIGFMDLVLEEDGRKVVVEHKSSSKKYAADQLRYDMQLTAYQLAARELGMGDVSLRFQILTKTRTPTMQIEDVRRDSQDEDDFLRTVVGVLRSIDTGISYPLRGWQCRSCPYQTACTKRP